MSALAGCSEDPASTTTPTETPSSSSPSLSSSTSDPPSDTAIAEQAVAELAADYFATLDRLRQNSDRPLKQLKRVAIGEQLAAQEVFTRRQRAAANRQTGEVRVVEAVVQSVNLDGQVPTAQMDICWDVSDVDVVDAKGESIVSPERADRGWTRYQVTNHHWKEDPSGGWRIASGRDLEKAPCSAA
ncbi:hypothetical protein EXE58_18845 [Nocardioides seonyuensis]|uniref:Nuclear transport factor 2 family protein n=1 Tax=Nocardioides seonyuensis TaxID=2518371 RepID=A0A4P7IKC7_9ACTN|nr:hypothetical protein [Nocardioides seonyuensis]QBX57280.1 hypothetical protein EXE58_18845 [Nocardioides seonyuensis]